MKQIPFERRLELLKLEGLGFSRTEIVKELSHKHGCTLGLSILYLKPFFKKLQGLLLSVSSREIE